MGDHRQTGKPSRYITGHPGQLSLAIPPWGGAVSTSESWDVNRHTARCTSPVSVVWQCKLVSGWGLMKRRAAPLCGPCGSGRTLHFRCVYVCNSAGACLRATRRSRSLIRATWRSASAWNCDGSTSHSLCLLTQSSAAARARSVSCCATPSRGPR